MGFGGLIKTMEMEVLPKGFRFRPTDEELINHYLRLKINCRHSKVKGDYVLCRMFHKPDEMPDRPKYDDVEPTGSSPSTNKSLLDC